MSIESPIKRPEPLQGWLREIISWFPDGIAKADLIYELRLGGMEPREIERATQAGLLEIAPDQGDGEVRYRLPLVEVEDEYYRSASVLLPPLCRNCRQPFEPDDLVVVTGKIDAKGVASVWEVTHDQDNPACQRLLDERMRLERQQA